jgi:vacuolar-type H+-ATPase subunit H
MTASSLPDQILTPLERIQQAERDCSHQIRVAQDAADARIQQARKQAALLKRDAIATGREQGERDYQAALVAARHEAQQIVAQAHACTENLAHSSNACFDQMVDRALAVILAMPPPEEGVVDES